VTISGDISGSDATNINATIGSEVIKESMLKAVDSAVDEECFTYESTTGDFEWQSCGSSYSASGTLLDLTGTTFSINEGTLTNNKFCKYVASTGIVCDSDATGLSYISETESTSSPNDTIYVDSLTASGSATNVDIALIAKGTGSLLAQIPDGTATGGNKRGKNTVDLQMVRDYNYKVAEGDYGTILGGKSNRIRSGKNYSTVGGGYKNSVFGNSSTVLGGSVNSAGSSSGGDYDVVLGGDHNFAYSNYSVVCSGSGNKIWNNSDYSVIGSGRANVVNVTGDYNTIISGAWAECITSAEYSVIGSASNSYIAAPYAGILSGSYARSDMYGQQSHACGSFASRGDAISSTLVARASTTNATETELFLDGVDDRLVIPSGATWTFDIAITARRTDADGESAGYRIYGVVDNNAGTTSLVSTLLEETAIEDSSAWNCTVTADDTNDALVIKCTGEASKTIYWVANISLVQIYVF
jgi:hypothetical protein